MDSPSTRQTRSAYVSTPSQEPAFPHGGAQNAEDLSFMTAPELAPMPIIHAKRLIRRAAEAVAEAATYDQVRVERERRDAVMTLPHALLC